MGPGEVSPPFPGGVLVVKRGHLSRVLLASAWASFCQNHFPVAQLAEESPVSPGSSASPCQGPSICRCRVLVPS